MLRLFSKSIFPSKLRWTLIAGLVVAAAMGAFWIFRAMQALDEAKADTSRSGVRFQYRPISDSKPDSVDFLSASPDFRDAQLFHDSLYLAGAGGIWVYDLAGEPRSTYLVGRDLPASAPTAMTVGTLAGDSESKLWIGTASGAILVYDGVRFSQIELQDKPKDVGGPSDGPFKEAAKRRTASRPDGGPDVNKSYGQIASLLMLPTGILLAGFSEGGVFSFDGAAIHPFHPSLRNVPVTALAGDEGDLWIGTRDRGVIHWQGGGTEDFQDPNTLPDKHVLSIAASRDRVFVGTSIGVAEFRGGRRTRTIADGILARSMLVTNDRLLIGTIDEGIVEVRLDNIKVSRALPAPELSPAPVRFLEIQGIPFALVSDGLFEQNPRTGLWARRIDASRGSWTDRNVSALAFDGSGKLWVGYFDRGIDIADSDGVRKAAHVEDDQVFCINRIVWDAERRTQVVATANGLVLFSPDGKIMRRLGKAEGLISEHVTDVAVSADGLAVATSAGITLMNAGGPESIYSFQGLANNHVYALGLNGPRLLAGTLGGLSLIENGFVRTSFTTANSPLKHNWISAMTRSGDSWFIGTYGGGILQMDGNGGWEEAPGVPRNTVINTNAMLAASDRVLAGTLDRGLLIYEPAARRWTTFTTGLPSLNVTALAANPTTIFIGTDNGIVRLPMDKVLQ